MAVTTRDPVFYRKSYDTLYRRSDGEPHRLPDSVLTRDGWKLLPALDVAMWEDLQPLTVDEADKMARRLGRALDGEFRQRTAAS